MPAPRLDTTRVTPLRLPGATSRQSGGRSTNRPAKATAAVYYAGEENSLVVKAVSGLIAKASAEPTAASPPLTLIGPPGCGKSLLASGVEAAWTQAVEEGAVVSISGIDFRRRLEQAISSDSQHSGTVDLLADRLASVRLLVIENLEGLSESEPSVDLFTSTVDRLESNGGTLLVTASKPLGEIAGLNARVVGRLAAGTTLEISAPAEATRQALLTAALSASGQQIDPAAAGDLASWLAADARRVLSAADRLQNRFGAKQTISRSDARAYIADAVLDQSSTPLSEIAGVVARYYSMSIRVLRSSSRKAPVVLARAVAIYLARQLTPLSYEEIGRYLGGRDHTTVMHNYNRINDHLGTDRALHSAIDDLLRKLGRADLTSAGSNRSEAAP